MARKPLHHLVLSPVFQIVGSLFLLADASLRISRQGHATFWDYVVLVLAGAALAVALGLVAWRRLRTGP